MSASCSDATHSLNRGLVVFAGFSSHVPYRQKLLGSLVDTEIERAAVQAGRSVTIFIRDRQYEVFSLILLHIMTPLGQRVTRCGLKIGQRYFGAGDHSVDLILSEI